MGLILPQIDQARLGLRYTLIARIPESNIFVKNTDRPASRTGPRKEDADRARQSCGRRSSWRMIASPLRLLIELRNAITTDDSNVMTLWPLGAYFLIVVLLVAGMLLLSHLLGERHQARATGIPYESGIVPAGSARARFSAKFYLIAMFFVIFDLEVIFLFAWAIGARELGWLGFGEAALFIGVLFAALVYLWRLGALDWGSARWYSR